VRVLLLSTYELGRQPFGLASPAAWLRRAGFDVTQVDLSRTKLDVADVAGASLVAVFLPMHTATRLALPVFEKVHAINPTAHLCAYGLYAPPNAELLRQHHVNTILGGEFEADLLALAERLRSTPNLQRPTPKLPIARPIGDWELGVGSSAAIPRLTFVTPDRRGLPPLSEYARLAWPDGSSRVVGYTEASRGCKHLCRHCPVVPIYNGRFRIVDPDVVIDDVRAQVAAGAQHITFGDPDFFNGIGHARRIVERLARECPGVSYDVTIKVEHLLAHAADLPRLVETGCAFVTSAFESVDDAVLERLEKGHTRADIARVSALMRDASLPLVPTFVAFTPWTSLESYLDLIDMMEDLGLAEHVAPVQWSIRLLIPGGSRLLALADVRALVGDFDPVALAYRWMHPDPRVDRLQRHVAALAGRRMTDGRASIVQAIRAVARAAISGDTPPPYEVPRAARATIPYLTEPWYC
jgi:radical SAM superfamily enzyme YgiQ (UPF0313 family)